MSFSRWPTWALVAFAIVIVMVVGAVAMYAVLVLCGVDLPHYDWGKGRYVS